MCFNGAMRLNRWPQKLDNVVSYKSDQIQENLTMSQIASRFCVHFTMGFNWKRQMLEGVADIFDKSNKSRKQGEAQTDQSFRQIGQMKVEKQEDLDLMRKILTLP